MEGIVKLMQDIESKCWERYKYHEITGCYDLCWVYNRLAIELEMPEMLELRYDYENSQWNMKKEYLGVHSHE